ncbi:plasmid partitioning protein RepB C-terminal domain-containing protein [Ruegeria sediminis]|uniref:plasmid partitioning protein RepB C-terminal domain-containing protein n=1 Tax=Ruegeria sediminis TaxID=2583820 RepID=UPI00319E102C
MSPGRHPGRLLRRAVRERRLPQFDHRQRRHADALLKATPPEQRTDYKPPQPEQPKGDPLEQIVKLEREMSQVQEKYKHAEENYGSELLNLVVAKGYLKKLMENEAVRSYVGRHAPEILEQFELVLNTVSMEEAIEQTERADGDEATARRPPLE